MIVTPKIPGRNSVGIGIEIIGVLFIVFFLILSITGCTFPPPSVCVHTHKEIRIHTPSMLCWSKQFCSPIGYGRVYEVDVCDKWKQQNTNS